MPGDMFISAICSFRFPIVDCLLLVSVIGPLMAGRVIDYVPFHFFLFHQLLFYVTRLGFDGFCDSSQSLLPSNANYVLRKCLQIS
jgi:uncharacterized membrane protein